MPRVPARELHAEDTLERQLPPSSTPSPPRCRSGSEAKRLLDNVIVAKLTLLKDASSSAPVTQKSERTLASPRREKGDVGRLGSLENVIEDEFAA